MKSIKNVDVIYNKYNPLAHISLAGGLMVQMFTITKLLLRFSTGIAILQLLL